MRKKENISPEKEMLGMAFFYLAVRVGILWTLGFSLVSVLFFTISGIQILPLMVVVWSCIFGCLILIVWLSLINKTVQTRVLKWMILSLNKKITHLENKLAWFFNAKEVKNTDTYMKKNDLERQREFIESFLN